MLEIKIEDLQNKIKELQATDKSPVQGTIYANAIDDTFQVSIMFSSQKEQQMFLDWLESKMHD